MPKHSKPTAPVPPTLGSGRYYLKKPVGMGGMAAVYRAWDSYEGRDVALKVLLPHASEKEKSRKRFLKEAQTMKQLDHPNIVRIYDIGEESQSNEKYDWYAMELCSGGNLATWLKTNGRLKPSRALKLTAQLLRGLEYAHVAGVVHRDIKPHNMLFAEEKGHTVKLTDFGIARVLRSQSARITATGDTLGTLAYMAPEQRKDARSADPRADLYAVGATLYLLVTGRRPVELTVTNTDPRVMGRLPPEMVPFIQRCTMHDPDERFQSAKEMYQACVILARVMDRETHDSVELPPESISALDDDTTIVQVQDS